MNDIKQTFGIKAYTVTDGKTIINYGEFTPQRRALKL